MGQSTPIYPDRLRLLQEAVEAVCAAIPQTDRELVAQLIFSLSEGNFEGDDPNELARQALEIIARRETQIAGCDR